MPKNYKAFTLLEMLIVVVISALMIGTFSYLIPDNNKEQIKFGEECSNYIYQEITNEILKIKRNQSITINNNQEYPKNSSIIFIQQGHRLGDNTINIKSYFQSDLNIEKSLLDLGKCQSNQINNKDKYLIQFLTGGGILISQNGDIENSTSPIILNTCIDARDQTTCIPTAKLSFNQAAQTINQEFCLTFTGSTCNQWIE